MLLIQYSLWTYVTSFVINFFFFIALMISLVFENSFSVLFKIFYFVFENVRWTCSVVLYTTYTSVLTLFFHYSLLFCTSLTGIIHLRSSSFKTKCSDKSQDRKFSLFLYVFGTFTRVCYLSHNDNFKIVNVLVCF